MRLPLLAFNNIFPEPIAETTLLFELLSFNVMSAAFKIMEPFDVAKSEAIIGVSALFAPAVETKLTVTLTCSTLMALDSNKKIPPTPDVVAVKLSTLISNGFSAVVTPLPAVKFRAFALISTAGTAMVDSTSTIFPPAKMATLPVPASIKPSEISPVVVL